MKSSIIQKLVVRLLITLIISFAWMKVFKIQYFQAMINYPIVFFAFLFITLAWFNYLKLDGLLVPTNYQKMKNDSSKKHKTKQMIDYVETNINQDTQLSKTQQMQCKLYANLICGILLLIPVIYTFIKSKI